MPIFDQGYQHWQGTRTGQAWRWLAVTRHGVRTQSRNKGVRRVLVVALFPALVLAVILCLWGLIEQKASLVAPLLALLSVLPPELRNDPRTYRADVWTAAFEYFLQVELFFSLLLVVLVGPNLISQDLRFNAIPLYFSRPVRRLDYFLGKLGVIGAYLLAVSVFPILLAYVLGVAFSLDIVGVVRDTGRLLLAAVAYGLIVVVSAGTLMLALSSLSRNSRHVSSMFIGLWLLGNIASNTLVSAVRVRWGHLVSYTKDLNSVRHALLGTDAAMGRLQTLSQSASPYGSPPPPPMPELPDYSWHWPAAVLAGLLVLSLWIMSSQVRSLDRLK